MKHVSILLAALLTACGGEGSATPVSFSYQVEGMHCNGCVEAITAELREVPGVTSVAVSLEGRSALVVADSAAREAAIESAITGLGYKVALRQNP